MSIGAMTAVWDKSTAKTTMLLTLLAIADEADDYGRNAYPSIETLARKTRQSDRNVIRMISDAEAIHELTIQRQANRSNRYTLTPGGSPIEPRPRIARGDKLSPLGGRRGDNLSPHGDKCVPDLSPDPLVPNGFHDDDDAPRGGRPVDISVDSEKIERAVQIVSRLNAAGVEGANRQRLAALWCEFDDGLEVVDHTCDTTATSAVAGNDGRSAKIRNMSGLVVKRLREAWETRTGKFSAGWDVADRRMTVLARPISDHSIARQQLLRFTNQNKETR